MTPETLNNLVEEAKSLAAELVNRSLWRFVTYRSLGEGCGARKRPLLNSRRKLAVCTYSARTKTSCILDAHGQGP